MAERADRRNGGGPYFHSTVTLHSERKSSPIFFLQRANILLRFKHKEIALQLFLTSNHICHRRAMAEGPCRFGKLLLLSLSQMSSGWRGTANRVMLALDVGRLQIAVVAADRVIPITSEP